MPSLRARREDIPLLVKHFVELSVRRTGMRVVLREIHNALAFHSDFRLNV
jgi:DNA-binding NtrC family response regulator